MESSKSVINQLKNGILPESLNFASKVHQEIDWHKVRYNTFKDPEYFYGRLPKGMENLPGIEKICQLMADNTTSPLEEMEERQRARSDAGINAPQSNFQFDTLLEDEINLK